MNSKLPRPLSILQIFAKYPEKGKVKTRLIESLGEQGSLELYIELLERTLCMAARLPFRVRAELWCTEDASMPYYRRALKRWPTLRYRRQLERRQVGRRQEGISLGDKLDYALRCSLKPTLPVSNKFDSKKIVVQIGTDCPTMNRRHIMTAIDSVAQDDAAFFIPAEDGGYVLGAYAEYFPGLFDGINWGSASVMQESIRNRSLYGLESRLSAPLWDIDRYADVLRYRGVDGPF